MTGSKIRLTSFLVYLIAIVCVHLLWVSTVWPLDVKSAWLASGALGLLIGRMFYPHFTPPLDGGVNSLLVIIVLLTSAEKIWATGDGLILWWCLLAFSFVVFNAAITATWNKPEFGKEPSDIVVLSRKIAIEFGKSDIIYTLLIGCCVYWFHRDNSTEVMAITFSWAVILVFRPVEAFLYFSEGLWVYFVKPKEEGTLGVLIAHRFPGALQIMMPFTSKKYSSRFVLIKDEAESEVCAELVQFKGSDEGDLYNCIPVNSGNKIPKNISKKARKSGDVYLLNNEQVENLELKNDHAVCGFVNVNTDIGELKFEVLSGSGLAEGQLVKVDIEEKEVLYQITNGLDREDVVRDRNTFGYINATARKIGKWNYDDNRFEPVPWLPELNLPVRMVLDTKAAVPADKRVGHFPETSYWCGINVSEAVTHNTAILGILGIGKSCLSLELVERMMLEDIKVICLDLTDQYNQELDHYIDKEYNNTVSEELREIHGKGDASKHVEEGGTQQTFEEKLTEKVKSFVGSDQKLLILNPSEYDIWRQDSKPFAGEASMVSLSSSEITAIVSKAALKTCQEMGMTDKARLCLVYEEAHSLVPEWNTGASPGDQTATNQSAKAILQGRKYGLGCLLVTQRTANVTKTILNQCNTIFAMRTFDDTGKGFLANYIGADYADLLPSIEARHAVFFGKASTCHNPVMIRLNDREDFLAAARPAQDEDAPQK